jgi:hypothetical protein
MNHLFSSVALSLRHWLIPCGIGISIFIIIEAEKAVLRRVRPAGLKDAARAQ